MGDSPLLGPSLHASVASGDALDVRHFAVHERISSLFTVNLVAHAGNHNINFDDVVGKPASFSMQMGRTQRLWTGVCNHIQQVGIGEADNDLSTYELTLVPALWFATQRRNFRMFQQISEPDIAQKLLQEWGIKFELRLTGTYKKRKYRVQYAESDFAFMSRMLEDAGIAYCFEQGGDESTLILSDALQSSKPRGGDLQFIDNPMMSKNKDWVTAVRVGQRVRPGAYTMRDHDYRRPIGNQPLARAAVKDAASIESKLERFHYAPGAFLFGTDKGDATPSADDKGRTRTDDKEAELLAQKRLGAKRIGGKAVSFETNAHDLAPASVVTIFGYRKSEIDGKKLLIIESTLSGSSTGEWAHQCEAYSADVAYYPPVVTPKPKVSGVESATVVGPRGEEIHCDEFGRVRVHFHWDRESKMDDNSSCWIHVSHPWGGAGYGGMNLPRVGQEVLVDFLGGDPDRPIIVGRVYTNLQKVPYKLPDDKTQSGWKSNSTNNTGGYNEIMFEDASGKELLRMQAERDLNKLVKRNENITVGNSRAKTIGVDEAITVGNNRTKSVGQVNATSAGVMHSVTIAPPGQGGAPPPAPTTVFTMIDKNIALTTGNATIQLLDKDIILAAKGSITLTALEGIKLTTQGQINQVSVDNTTIDGKKVLINCAPPPSTQSAPPNTQLAAASTSGGGSGGTVGAVLGASFVGPTKG